MQPVPASPGKLAPFTATQPLVASAATGPTREVFGFATAGSLGDTTVGYPSWNFDLLTTVAFFALHIQYNGTLVGDSNYDIWNSSTLTGLVNTAHAHGVKVVVTIVGPSVTADQCDALYNRATTIAQIVNQVTLKGVDGVNIDYEGQLATCKNNDPTLDQSNQSLITALARDFRAGLDAAKPGYYLSIDTYSGSAAGNDGFFNIPDLAKYVDSFFIMAYDMDFSGWKTAGCSKYCMNPVSPLGTYTYNDTTAVNQYAKVAGAGKTILGLPYYGRVACVASAVVHAYPTGSFSAATYLEAASVRQSPDVKALTFKTHRDPTDPAGLERWDSWYDNKLGCWREMYWDDTTSLATRYNLVNRSNIRGVGFWTLNYGGGSPELWDLLSAYFKVWSAGYDMSQAPTKWVAGQPQTFSITVTNSGEFTWPSGGTNPVYLNLHFTTRTGGIAAQSSWLKSFSVALPADVPPGGSTALTVTLVAPTTTGSMYLEAEMLKSHQFWFSQWQPVPVAVAAQSWGAGYDMSQAPTAWRGGQIQTFTVSVTNKGNMTWPAGGSNPVMLDLHFAKASGGSANIANWLTSQVYRLPADVLPGQSTTLSVAATAPSTSGYLYLEAELFKSRQFWFKQWQPLLVTLYGPWGASYDLSQAPSTWAVTQTKSFQVTITNQGTLTWPSGGSNPVRLDLHFTPGLGGSAKISSWLTSQSYVLTSDVTPGASLTLTVNAQAPAGSGSMYLEAQLYKSKQFWFQQWSGIRVTVLPAFSAAYDSCQVPIAWSPAQSQAVTLVLTNVGSQTWPSGGTNPVQLDLHFTTAAGGTAMMSKWLTSQVFSLPSDVVPGGSISVNATATAPAKTGSLYLEAQMFKRKQFWFQQWQASVVSIGSPTWGANYDVCAAPRSWTPGQSQTFQVTLVNAGSQTWPSGGANPVELNVHFTSRQGGSGVISSWFNSYNFLLPLDVAPGQTATVTVTIAAPTTASRPMYVEAQVFKDHQLWFPQWKGVPVTVG
jgi:spore germination protein YaaH